MTFEDYPIEQIVVPLQEWFDTHARALPWRSEQTPYHVWLSEIMLQQTRVEAVLGYYRRFLEKLPDIQTLASADEETLLKLWEGLGYYSRVRNLQKAARMICDCREGRIPSCPEELRKLPGIGSYTAGAIASLAFGIRVPAVDGNVLRVLARICGDASDISDDSAKKRLQSRLQSLYDKDLSHRADPRKLNQGLMELGALVCIPNGGPDCEHCPAAPFCRALIEKRIPELPVRSAKKARRIEDRTVLILKDDAVTAIHKRPAKGLLAGLWELPGLEGHRSMEDVARYVRQLGFTPLHIERLPDAKHIFSHVEWHMRGYRVRIEEEAFATPEQLRLRKEEGILFAGTDELENSYAMPSAFSAFRPWLF